MAAPATRKPAKHPRPGLRGAALAAFWQPMALKQPPHTTARTQAEAEARRAREAEALRENLRRRKTQARSRDTAEKPDPNQPTKA
jgi:hypothetical protein